jgi:hypothetical protein
MSTTRWKDSHGPVDQVQVEVIRSERSKGLFETFGCSIVISVPPGGRSKGARSEYLERAMGKKSSTYSLEVMNSSERGTPDSLIPCPTSSSF